MKQNKLSKNETILSELKEQEEKFDSSKKVIEDLKKKYAETVSRSKKESLKTDIDTAEKEYKIIYFDCKEAIADILKRKNPLLWIDDFIGKEESFSGNCERMGIEKSVASRIKSGARNAQFHHAVALLFGLKLHILTAECWLNKLGFSINGDDEIIVEIRNRLEKRNYYLGDDDIKKLRELREL